MASRTRWGWTCLAVAAAMLLGGCSACRYTAETPAVVEQRPDGRSVLALAPVHHGIPQSITFTVSRDDQLGLTATANLADHGNATVAVHIVLRDVDGGQVAERTWTVGGNAAIPDATGAALDVPRWASVGAGRRYQLDVHVERLNGEPVPAQVRLSARQAK